MPYSTLTEVADLELILQTVRKPDLVEMIASHGDYKAELRRSFEESEHCITLWTDDNKILGVLGINILFDKGVEFGCPWCVSAEGIEKYRFWFVRTTKHLSTYWVKRFPYLQNWVDSEYTQAHNWLRILGFEIRKPNPPLMQGGREFYQVIKYR
jgi:hypothetical protein